MCRGTTATGRRCPCDTTAARQARRDSQRLRNHNSSERTTPTPKTEVLLPGADTVQEQLKKVQTFRSLVEKISAGETPIIRTTDESGTTLYTATVGDMTITSSTRSGVLEQALQQAELHTTKLGENILEAAESSSVDEETLRSLYVDRRAENLEKLDAAVESLNEKKQTFTAALPMMLKMVKTKQTPEEMKDIGEQFFLEKGNPALAEKLNEAYIQLAAEEASFSALKKQISAETNSLSEEFIEKNSEHIQSLKNVLKQVRSFGGELTVAENSHAQAVKSVQAAASLFPTDWVEKSNNLDTGTGAMRVKKSTGRAHYNDNATQRLTYRKVLQLDSFVKEESFVPSPEDNVSGMWFKATDNGWFTDPYSGHSHEVGFSGNKPVWVVVEAETFSPGVHAFKGGVKSSDSDVVPAGKEWRRETVVQVNKDTGKEEPADVWRRPLPRVSKGKDFQPELTISQAYSSYHPDDGFKIASHELSHRMESSNKYVTDMERAFLKRRTTLPDGTSEPFVRLANLPENDKHPYGRNETTQKDGFVNAYMGKTYESPHREILSMGMESIFAGSHGALLGVGGYKRDRDYKSFILGLLASG